MERTRTSWIVQRGVLDDEPFVAALQHLGAEVQRIDRSLEAPQLVIHNTRPVLFRGSIPMLRRIARENAYTPLAFNRDSWSMSKWLVEWHYHCLNRDAIFLPWGLFKKRAGMCFDMFKADRLFIRPDSGWKSFTGQTVAASEADFTFRVFDQTTSVVDSTMIAICAAKPVPHEWRFVMTADQGPVAASAYAWDDRDITQEVPADAWAFARQMAAQQWQPDEMYVLDIMLGDHGFEVIEIGCVNTSGLYHCAIDPVIAHAERLATREFYI